MCKFWPILEMFKRGHREKGECMRAGKREHFLEIYKIQVDEIILLLVADRFLSIGRVSMS